jgi:hypothetical protein
MTDSELNEIENPANAFEAGADTADGEFADPWDGVEVRQRADKEEDAEPTDASLNPDDAGADADLPRPSRAEKQRIRRRTHVSTAIPALLLIVVGAAALVRPALLTPPLLAGALAAIVFLTVLLRFLFTARRERGLFFITMIAIFAVVLVTLDISGVIDLQQMWPLFISVPGLAMLTTFVFERSHERGLVLPAFILIIAGVVLLPFTTDSFDTSLLKTVAVYWPILFILLALALLPRAIRDRAD